MTATVESADVRRDHNGRPYIKPVDGGKELTYTRTSNMSKTLSDMTSLGRWQRNLMTLGYARQPALLKVIAELDYEEEEIPRFIMDSTVEAALEVGGANNPARWGDALHSMAEAWDAYGIEPDPSRFTPDLMDAFDAYRRLTADWHMLACEGFVVCDELMCAGSYDRVGLMPDGRIVVADIKTGPDEHKRIQNVSIQCAIYAHSQHYIPSTGERVLGPLEGVDQATGVMIQIARDRSVDRLIPLDLIEGWRRAKLAAEVRANRTMKCLPELPPF